MVFQAQKSRAKRLCFYFGGTGNADVGAEDHFGPWADVVIRPYRIYWGNFLFQPGMHSSRIPPQATDKPSHSRIVPPQPADSERAAKP